MTADTLKSYSCKLLAEMAKKRGVEGWHSMKKDQLVRALLRMSRSKVLVAKAPAAKASSKTSSSRSRTSSTSASSRKTALPVKAALPVKPAKSMLNKAQAQSAPKATIAAKPPVAASKLPAPPKLAAVNKIPPVKSTAASHTNGKLPATRIEPPKPVLVKSVTNGKPHDAKAEAKLESPVAKRLQRMKAKLDQSKDLSVATARAKGASLSKDRLVVMVRDPFWLHAYWELSRQGVERAEAALGQEWHAAKPILRLLQVSSSGTTTAAESLVRDIEIHGGVNNWYIDVQDPPKSYRLEIGYRGPSGRFFVLARSNVVSTPKAGVKDALDEHWTEVAENYDKIYAQSGGYSQDGSAAELQELFEERLRRPMGSPMVTRYGTGAEGLLPRKKEFFFEIDAELIVYGVTEPNAHVTLQGDPVRLRPDGTFTVRFTMPNCRQVIPAVASSANGVEQRTIVLAVERNTKTMEPLIREAND